MKKYFHRAVFLAVISFAVARGGELLSFIEKPQQLTTGDIGKGVNHYRPRWSPDGRLLSFELIDGQSLRTFIIAPATGEKYECRGKVKNKSESSLDLFDDQRAERLAVTRLSWSGRLFNGTAMYCFTDDGLPYKAFAYQSKGKMGFSTPGELIRKSDQSKKNVINDVLLPELGYPPAKGQPPVIFTDNQSGSLFAITETQQLKQMTYHKPQEKVTDFCGRFHPTDNKSLVFVRAFEGNADLYIIEDVAYPEESTKPLVTFAKSEELAPSWSPDGSKIAFYSNFGSADTPENKTFDLYVINPQSQKTPILIAKSVRPDNVEDKLSPPYIGPQWIGNDIILFVKDDKHLKDPLMYVQLSTGAISMLTTETILNDSPNVLDLGDGTYLIAYTTFGKPSTDLSKPDISNKIFYGKLILNK
ncbi:MAG: hypothetical protein GX409_02265 [candidate division Zixibacteria bacterium]|nr:hypothetical protein [candidate division Zixibacteria bacterium]